MAAELAEEERKFHKEERKIPEIATSHGQAYGGYRGHENVHRISQPISSNEPHLKHSYANAAIQAGRHGIEDIRGGIQGAGQFIGGIHNKYEGWQAQRRQKELENRPYEEYKYHKKLRDIDIKSREEALNQQRLRGARGLVSRPVYGGHRGYSSGGYSLVGGGSNPFASWGVGQQQGTPKSYEYANRSGAPRRYERSEESQALAERARALKTRSKQLRKIARRERALANREAQMETQQPQQGGGFGHELFGHWRL